MEEKLKPEQIKCSICDRDFLPDRPDRTICYDCRDAILHYKTCIRFNIESLFKDVVELKFREHY